MVITLAFCELHNTRLCTLKDLVTSSAWLLNRLTPAGANWCREQCGTIFVFVYWWVCR